jgi:hypothetical protein
MKPKSFSFLLNAICVSSFIFLCSCHQDPPKFKWEGKYGPVGGLIVCCQIAGNDCYDKGAFFYPPVLRTYIENDNLSGFFKNENWQSYFPELIDRQDIVDQIIAVNPKGEFLKDEQNVEMAFVILKDKTKAALTDNVYVAFKASPECDKIFSTP